MKKHLARTETVVGVSLSRAYQSFELAVYLKADVLVLRSAIAAFGPFFVRCVGYRVLIDHQYRINVNTNCSNVFMGSRSVGDSTR